MEIHKNVPLEYWQKGDRPELLVMTGMHGDEYGIIECVEKYLQDNEERLPDFLYIPRVSSSAVASKTRENNFGHDINRSFLANFDDIEVKLIIDLLKSHHFTLCLDMHEDVDLTNQFYLYDSGIMNKDERDRLEQVITTAGFVMHEGADDPEDQALGYEAERGYISTPLSTLDPASGFFWTWALANQIVDRIYNSEFPAQATREEKMKLTKVFMDYAIGIGA